MERIGLIIKSHIAKVEKLLDFAEEIISIENIGVDKSLYGQRAEYIRLKVIYKFNGKIQVSEISGQWGTNKQIKVFRRPLG